MNATTAVVDAGPAAALVLMFALGARHGIEPDHLAAIDGITLRAHDRRQPGAAWTGSWFAVGHGAGVTLLALLIHVFSSGLAMSPGLADALEWVPLALLFAVGGLNLRALLGAQAYQPASVRGWLVPRALRERSDALAALLVGGLFALLVDVVTQLSAWSYSTTQQRGVAGVLLAGLLFSAGLALTATIDSALLCHLLRRQRSAQSLLRLRRGMGWFVVVLSFGVAVYGSVDKLGWLSAVERATTGWLWLIAAGLASAVAAGVAWRRDGARRLRPTAAVIVHPPTKESATG